MYVTITCEYDNTHKDTVHHVRTSYIVNPLVSVSIIFNIKRLPLHDIVLQVSNSERYCKMVTTLQATDGDCSEEAVKKGNQNKPRES